MADDSCNFHNENDFDDLENEDESNDWAETYIGEETQWINYGNNPSEKNTQTEENSRYENLHQVEEDVYEIDNKAKGLSRMELNDHKAGMVGLDKQKINQIIFEASKGSKFYENELKKEKQVAERIAKQNMSLEKLTHQQRKEAFQAIDLIVEELERKRDLSRTFVHIDMDAFYAAVEILDNPELGDKPMAVGGNSMLSTSNYPARRYGVRAAMPGFIAKKLCPELIIVPPHFEKYKEYSRQVQDILAEYDPNFAMASLDEAYLDLTEHLTERHKGQGKRRLLTSKFNINRMVKNEIHPNLEQTGGEIVVFDTDAEEAVRELRFRIEQKTKLTASAGIAPNAMLAKICSDRNKPNGQFYLKPNRNDVMEFIRSLPIRKISGIGRVSEQMLKALGIETCEDLFRKRDLLYLLHSPISFKFLIEISLGLGPTSLATESKRKSIGTEETFSEISKPTELLDMCDKLCQSLAQDIKGQKLEGKTVTIKLKTVNFEIKCRSSSTIYPVSTCEELSSIAKELLKREMNTCFPEPLKLRLMGVRLSNLQDTSSNSSKEAKQNTITGFLKQKQNVKSQGMLVSIPAAQRLNAGEHFGLTSLSQHCPKESDLMTGAYACQRTDQHGSYPASLSSEGVASNSFSKKSSSLSGSVSTSDSILLNEHSDDTNPSAVFCPVCELSVGAAIFSSIEGPYEQRILSDLRQRRDDFLVKHPCVSDKELENFVKHVVAAQDMGIPPLGNASDKRSWGFGSSFFFAGTVVTTIGYGNIAPLSGGGKVFCMVFAVFGIPMTAIMLTAIVERLLQFTEVLEKFLCSTCTVRGIPPAYLRLIHLSLIMCGAIALVIIIPATFFMFLEDWSYFEALYFCFISLTTIGLGDFVPGDDPKWRRSEYRSLYKVFCVFFFITGLTFLLLILELCAKIPDDHPGMLFSCHKPFLREDEADVSATVSTVHPRYSISSRGSSSSSPDRQRLSRNSYERISSRDNESR